MPDNVINKVVYGGRTLIDLTDTTATANSILSGYGAYGADGVWIDGIATAGGSGDGSVYQDGEGYIVLDDGPGTHVEVDALNVTTNGTYTASTGHAYSPVTVNVSGGTSVVADVVTTLASGGDHHAISGIDISSDTVTAAHLETGYTAHDATGTLITGALSPSGVKYVYSDVDGEGAWDISNYQYVSYDYAPVKDNKFRFWIEVNSSDLTFKAPVSVPSVSSYQYTGAIDWGDGSAITEYEYGNTDHIHTYEEAGRYCVSIWRTGGANRFGVGSLRSSDRSKVVAIEYYNLGYPTSYLTDVLSNVKKLRYSSSQTNIYITDYASLTDVVLPDSATTIVIFVRCYSLEKLILPESVTAIENGAFSDNTAMKEYHLLPTIPPTLGTGVFRNIPSSCIIYVPYSSDHSILAAYQTANNWSNYASYMQEEPQ